MRQVLTYVFLLLLAALAGPARGQTCPTLIFPAPDSQNVPVDSPIS